MENLKQEAVVVGGVSADEWLLLIAYRGCNDRRKNAVRTFTQKLSGMTSSEMQDDIPANVVQLANYTRRG